MNQFASGIPTLGDPADQAYMGGYKSNSELLTRRGRLNGQLNALDKKDPYYEFKRSEIQTELDRINGSLGNVLG
jgi:hypothetical protein